MPLQLGPCACSALWLPFCCLLRSLAGQLALVRQHVLSGWITHVPAAPAEGHRHFVNHASPLLTDEVNPNMKDL